MTRTRRIALSWFLIVLHAATASSCGGSADVGGMSRANFVAVMSELHALATVPELDSAARATKRDSVLKALDVSPEDLERAARSLAATPERASEVWGEIERRSEKIRTGEDSLADSAGQK